MNKELASKFLDGIQHEREQDIELTEKILSTFSLNKLVQNGYAINNLLLENIKTGLAGKFYVELIPDTAIMPEIKENDIKVGDIVIIKSSTSSGKKKSASHKHRGKDKAKNKGNDNVTEEDISYSGVIYKISSTFIVITIDEQLEIDTTKLFSLNRLHIVKTTNVITYKRMESTMRKLAEFNETPSNHIMQLLLGDSSLNTIKTSNINSFYNSNLNDSQKEAVNFAVNNELSIIHGPPGTGKTHTLIEIILQLLKNEDINKTNQRILVCGPSNIAVDTILERLSHHLPGNYLLRIGHPARLLESNLSHSLDILSKNGDIGQILKDIYKDIDRTIKDIKKMKSYKDRKLAWKDVKELRKELRIRERKIINDLILESKVVVATLHGSSSRELCSIYNNEEFNNKLFDTIIIDEVSQSLEPQCWIPLISHEKSNYSKLILAGDNKQLPPTVKTEDDTKIQKLLETTIFDRLATMYGDELKKMLNVQYRMNEKIMNFPSLQMYHGKLIADESVATLTLIDLPGVDDNDDTTEPLIWYDTQGDDFLETDENDGATTNGNKMKFMSIISSKFNDNEALLVKHHVESLIDNNVAQDCIGIISPYSAQVSLLKKLINKSYPMIEISTVDGFQGREKEVIIVSLVRSNEKFEVGFLKEERRLNVAMSRPKKQLCVIGNMEMLQRCGNKYLKEWANWSEENSDLRYPDIDELL